MSLVSLRLRQGVTEAAGRVQATVSAGSRVGGTLVLTLLLAGCGTAEKMSPVEWWHNLEGGPIAQDRPPPPAADAPYPNLSTVPPRPPAPDPAARAKLTSGLVADRTNAQYAASLAPLPAQPMPRPRPAPLPPQPAGDDISTASLPAATAPKLPMSGPPRPALSGPPQPPLPNVPMTPVKAAPTATVEQAPLAAPIPDPPLAPPAPATFSPPPAPATFTPPPAPAAVSSAPGDAKRSGTARIDAPQAEATPAAPLSGLPPVPSVPPPPAALPGLPAGTLPTPPPVAPPPPPPPKAAPSGAPVLVAFPPGSSTLPVESLVSLKLLARSRGDASIVIVGYGDTTSADATAQSAAMPLALARARAIAANLLAAGVPAGSLRITAEAQGQGGAARLTN